MTGARRLVALRMTGGGTSRAPGVPSWHRGRPDTRMAPRLAELPGPIDHLGEGVGDGDAGRFEGGDLRFGGAFATGDDGAGVAHPLTWRRRAAGDEAEDRLLEVDLDVLGG